MCDLRPFFRYLIFICFTDVLPFFLECFTIPKAIRFYSFKTSLRIKIETKCLFIMKRCYIGIDVWGAGSNFGFFHSNRTCLELIANYCLVKL